MSIDAASGSEQASLTVPAFVAPYAPPDEALAAAFLGETKRDPAREQRIDTLGRGLVEAVRAKAGALGGIEDFLHE
jgi:RHH-type proline utilization regulon transcriptional repressor/proline dehydrogenase/delta 1-pyrroline-5-carboxylate dehydrogenase